MRCPAPFGVSASTRATSSWPRSAAGPGEGGVVARTAACQDCRLGRGRAVAAHRAAGNLADESGVKIAEAGEGFLGEVRWIVEDSGHGWLSMLRGGRRAGQGAVRVVRVLSACGFPR
ncbi:hypothetical protein QF036_000032 [Arthrobacter globiformis]|nr:hypothetical protein [Arthrobacter globiformis]